MKTTALLLSRGLLLLFVFISLWVSFPATPPPLYAESNGPATFGSISGVVRNTTGEPLAGIKISLYQTSYFGNNWYAGGEVITDNAGGYRFAALAAGVYRIAGTDLNGAYGKIFYANANNIFYATDIVTNGTSHTNVDLTLAISGQITGVIDQVDDNTLVEKAVLLYQKAIYPTAGQWDEWQQVDFQALLPAQREFRFRGLAIGSYYLCATGNDGINYWQECYNNVYKIEQAESITVTAGTVISNVAFVLGDGADLGVIRGQVTSPQAEPLAGIGVYVVPVGANPISPTPSPVNPTLNTTASARLSTQAVTPSLPLEVTPTPVPRIMLPSVPYQYYSTTTSDGSYVVNNIIDGAYQLFFYDAAGRYGYEYYNDVTDRNHAVAVTVTQRHVITDVNAQLALGARITGTLTLVGQPAPPARLALYRYEGSQWIFMATATNDPATGRYTFGGLPAGLYRLEASSFINYSPVFAFELHAFYGGDQWETAAHITLAEAGIQPNIDINFDNGPHFNGAISGRVTAAGAPRAAVKVSLYTNPVYCCGMRMLGTAQTYTITDQEGRYRIEGLSNGTYFVRYEDQSGLLASLFYPNQPMLDMSQYVATNDTATTADIDIDLPQAGMVKGRVFRRDLSAVPNLTVLAVLMTPNQMAFVYRETQTNVDGTYLLQGLHPGTYKICAAIKGSYNSGYSTLECYGGADSYLVFINGHPITVEAGQTVNAIDLLWGPDYKQYLPVVTR